MTEKIRIGVIGPAEIAYRRSVPAMLASDMAQYVGIAHASLEEWPEQSAQHASKCDKFKETYGGRIYDSIGELIQDASVGAVYIPLPPSAHHKWAMQALEAGKHVFLEKPFTNSLEDTREIIEYADAHNLAVHENYAYAYHRQIAALEELSKSGRIGELRMVRSSFSFPYRGEGDFRYHANRGGGAIVDCGGYPINLVRRFLGDKVELLSSAMSSSKGHDVDTYGIAELKGSNDVLAQVSWGTDNTYRCCVELHGSTGLATTERVFSPPAEMKVSIKIRDNNGEEEMLLEPDDQFKNSLEHFCMCIENDALRKEKYQDILEQAEIINQIIKK